MHANQPLLKSRIEFCLKWLDYHLLLRLFCLLPQPVAYAAGRLRARFRCWVRSDTRNAARRHMREFLPVADDQELERLVREYFYSPCLDEMETYYIPRLTPARFSRLMSVEGLENLDCCLQRGRGAIVFSTHSAGVALTLTAFGLLGYKMNVVGRSLEEDDNPLHPAIRSYARRRVGWIQDHLGCPFIAPARGTTSLLAERLRANELVYVLLDVPPEIVRQKTVARFLGRDCLFPSGFARLAAETGCALVPCQTFYLPNWRHQKLVFHSPIDLSGSIEADVQRCVSVQEALIREHPPQWYVWDNLPMLWLSNSQQDGNSA